MPHVGELLSLFKDHLRESYKTVFLNGQNFSLEGMRSGVSQGSVLAPFGF